MKLTPTILDLQGLVYNAYHAAMSPEPLVGNVKEKVNTAAYGFETFLNKFFDPILEICESPIHMIAVLDDGNTYRKAMYPEYKEGRADKKEAQDIVEKREMEMAMAHAKQFLASLGIPLVKLRGEEADDVIAYLVQNLQGSKIVCTIDKDLLVLSGPNVTVFRNGRLESEFVDSGVTVPSHLVSLYLSIVGDSSDGFPGLHREGPKAWEKLIEQFGVDGMEQLQDLAKRNERLQLKSIAAVAGNKTLTKLAENYDSWLIQFNLAQLHPEICASARRNLEWYKRAPLKSRMEKVLGETGTLDLLPRYERFLYKAILVTQDNLAECITEIAELTKETPAVAWDYETYDVVKNPDYLKAANGKSYVDVLNSVIAGCSFAVGPNMNIVYYFSVRHANTRNVSQEWVLNLIKHFEEEDIEMVAQNCLPGDTEVLTREGWVRIEDAEATREIMQWDPETGGLSFVIPSHKTETTSETLLKWSKGNHQTTCTPAHRVYYRHPNQIGWSVGSAQEVDAFHANEVILPLSGMYTSQSPLSLSDAEARLLEAIRADGSFVERGSHCRFHLSKERKVSRLEIILNSLGMGFSKTIGKDGAYSIGIAACPLTDTIKNLLGDSKEYGFWVLDLPMSAKQAILEELTYWDGHRGKGGSNSFFSTSRATVESLQVLAHTSGWRLNGKFKPNNKPYWKPIFTGTLRRSSHCKLDAYNRKAEVVPWCDKVYCFTVPTGAFMVRQGGKVAITGNCAFEATITKMQLSHDIKFWNDTKAFGHHIDENNPNGLKLMSKAHLNYSQTDYHTTLAKAGASDMSEISGEQVLEYSADDSLVTAHLYQFFTILSQLEGTYDFIKEYECPAVQPLMTAYINGVMMDPAEMARQTASDQTTVVEKLALLRQLLQDHCTQPNFAGVESLYEDQKSYATAKAKEKFKDKADVDPAEVEGAIKQALQEFQQKLKDNCRYVEPYEVREVKHFSPTPTQLTKVAGYLGLPAFDKNTKKFVTEWLLDHAEFVEDPRAKEFISKLPNMFIKDKTDILYLEFKLFCEELIRENTIPVMVGTELNLGSPNQMQYLLYLMLALPVRVRTKVQKKSLRHKMGLPGSPSTDASAIDFALANDCAGEHAWKADALKALKAYAAASTRLSIYWGPYPLWMGSDNIMHPNFISPGTVTRRPTGSSPNLLQVSKGPVRKCFVPRHPDNVIVSVDFASQELRVLAAVTEDPNFLSAYNGEKAKDLHAMTACGIVPSVAYKYEGVDPSVIWMDGALVDYEWFKSHQDDDNPVGKMLKDVRGISKTVNFGVGYGAVGATVSQQAMIPLELADAAVEGFHSAYPGVNEWKKKLYAFAKANGYVKTTYGSRRHCGNNLTTGNRSEIGRWERQLSNFCIQAQCADLLKVVLADAYRTELFPRHEAYLIAPIYDELLSEVPRKHLHSYLHELADLMEVYMPGLSVPMVADCSFGWSWGKQEEVGARPTQETIDAALAKIDAYLAEKHAAEGDQNAKPENTFDDDVLAIVDESDMGYGEVE